MGQVARKAIEHAEPVQRPERGPLWAEAVLHPVTQLVGVSPGEDRGPDRVAVTQDRAQRASRTLGGQPLQERRDALPQVVVPEGVDQEAQERSLSFRHALTASTASVDPRRAPRSECAD